MRCQRREQRVTDLWVLNQKDIWTPGGTPRAADFFRDKAAGMDPGLTKSGLGALETSSNYLTGVGDTLQNNLFSKEGLKAALIPAGQGMTDLAVAENRRAMRDYERELADYEASIGDSSDMGNRALAIRQSMEAYGFPEDEILAAIEAAGYANGGRVGLKGGGMDYMSTKPSMMGNPAVMENIENMREFMIANPDIEDITDYSEEYKDDSEEVDFKGIEAALEGVDEDEKSEFLKKLIKFRDSVLDVPKNMSPLPDNRKMKDGGLMNLGGREMDMRTGGFIPIGKKERADDVPARLSKNEFVMTADAVRAAGGGSVNEGARRMYNLMNNLEAKV